MLVHERFAAVARRARDRVALRTPAGTTTYGELHGGARRLARVLASRGYGREDRVAIVATDHATITTALLGVLEAGCVFAPLDAAAGPHLERQLAALGCSVAVTDHEGRARVPLGLSVIELDRTHALAEPTLDSVPPQADPDAACSIYFTSGSTGAPRAIAGRLSGIDHHIAWELAHLAAGAATRGTILHASSYDAYLPDVLVPLCAGGVAIAPPSRVPEELWAWLAREHITLVHCVPSLFRSLLACADPPRTSIEAVLLAGEVVRAEDVRRARAVLGDRVRLVNLYGPSEATLVKLHHDIVDADLARDSIPIGRPMPDVTVWILDDDGRPTDGIGEIAIQSRYGAHGYAGEPALTRERFVPAFDGSGETIYRTGDLGRRLADGVHVFCGRRDRQIKLCGARVNLDEVEAILAGCDGVTEAAVVAEDTALRGFVVVRDGVDMARIRREASAALTPAMRLAWLTRVAAFPRTPSGKIDRRRLAEGEDT